MIKEKLSELCSRNPYYITPYVAIRKHFKDVPIHDFISCLDNLDITTMKGHFELVWSKENIEVRARKHYVRLLRENNRLAKEKGFYNITVPEVIKYMQELVDYRGIEYARNHFYIFYKGGPQMKNKKFRVCG